MSSKKETMGLEDSEEVVLRRLRPMREVLSCGAMVLVSTSTGFWWWIGLMLTYCYDRIVFHETLLRAGEEAQEGEDEGRRAEHGGDQC
jgi:hypothetical protein